MIRYEGPAQAQSAQEARASDAAWTAADIPDQTGRVAVVTGANTGVGFEIAAALAGHGAQVVLAVRDPDKGRAAATRIVANNPCATVTVQQLDLGALDSIRGAARQLRG